MKTIKEIIGLSAVYLSVRGVDRSRFEAELLISEALGMKRLDLYLYFDRPMSDAEIEKCRKMLIRRGGREPWQYIAGKVDFLGCSLEISRAVLIPRQETEILSNAIIDELKSCSLMGKIFWDVCCGSGCIAIAVKKALPCLEVAASDISADALSIARKNADANQVRIDFFEGDLLKPYKNKKTDFLVCNPPYISESDYSALEPEVKNYEPKTALVGGESGVEFYERLASSMHDCLRPSAKVWMEYGEGQGPLLEKIFKGQGWKHCRSGRDWSGKDRFFSLENE